LKRRYGRDKIEKQNRGDREKIGNERKYETERVGIGV